MFENPTSQFYERLTRLRAGEPGAIAEFVAEYEPFIRRTLRYRISKASLQSAGDSVDVCQSVLGSFLIRLRAGDYELSSEQDLIALLMGIANKKFLFFQRRERAAKRDRRQTQSLQSVPDIASSVNQDPLQRMLNAELLTNVEGRLSHDERLLFQWRGESLTWDTIGQRLGEAPVNLRKKLSRAIHRVTIELGFEDAVG